MNLQIKGYIYLSILFVCLMENFETTIKFVGRVIYILNFARFFGRWKFDTTPLCSPQAIRHDDILVRMKFAE